MTPQAQLRRIGWLAALAICTTLYLLLHFKVHTVANDVVKAERRIVALENENMLLETEFLVRSSQIQLASWNRVNFGYTSPEAGQFLSSERDLARFAAARDERAPQPIQLASADAAHETPPFPRLVSPLTGKPVGEAASEPQASGAGHLALGLAPNAVRINLNAAIGVAHR